MGDRIDVPLELGDFEVSGCELVDGVLEVAVASTRRAACNHCGSMTVRGHGRNERMIRDRACAYPTVLRWSQRRFRCMDCGRTSRERHPELAGRKAVTNRFRRRLFERATREPFSNVARGERVSTYRVLEAFDSHASQELARVPLAPPRALSIDESAFRRRFRYHTVISDPERGVVIDLFEGRSKTGVAAWLGQLSPQVSEGIETVVMDMFWPYRHAVEAALPNARIVADKFHVLRAISEAAQKVRRRFGRRSYHQRLGRDGGSNRQHHPASDPELFRARWVFMKRASRLTEAEVLWLDDLFDRTEPEVRAAWLLKESFAAIYQAPDRAEAERRLDTWIHNLPAAGIAEFTNVWRTLRWWREQILAYFDDPLTNGFAEGITNKIKVMKRSAYGFRTPERYRRKVLLSTSHRQRRADWSHRYSR